MLYTPAALGLRPSWSRPRQRGKLVSFASVPPSPAVIPHADDVAGSAVSPPRAARAQDVASSSASRIDPEVNR